HGGGGQAHQGYRVLGCRRGEALPRKLPQSRQAGSRILRRRAGPDRVFEIRLLAGGTEPEIRTPPALRVSRSAAIDHRLLRVSTGTTAKVTACPGLAMRTSEIGSLGSQPDDLRVSITSRVKGSLHLGAREFNHLSPLPGFVCDERAKLGGRAVKHGAAQR